jgi:hypothetical protein
MAAAPAHHSERADVRVGPERVALAVDLQAHLGHARRKVAGVGEVDVEGPARRRISRDERAFVPEKKAALKHGLWRR